MGANLEPGAWELSCTGVSWEPGATRAAWGLRSYLRLLEPVDTGVSPGPGFTEAHTEPARAVGVILVLGSEVKAAGPFTLLPRGGSSLHVRGPGLGGGVMGIM